MVFAAGYKIEKGFLMSSIATIALSDRDLRYASRAVTHLLLVVCLASLIASANAAQEPTQDPGAANEAFRRATQAMRAGQLDVAAAGFANAIKLNPKFSEAYFNLGLVQTSQGLNEEAIGSLQKAVALKPQLHGANLFLGIAEYRQNRLDKAAAALQKETSAYPKDAGAWMWLGVVRLAQEQPAEAAEALDKAAKLDPKNVDILYHRGRAHLLVSKDSYTEMFRLDPKSWRVHQVLAQTDAESEHHEEAVSEYLEAIKLAPMQPGLHEELGSEYRILVKLPEAEAAFRHELEIDPNNVLAQYKLGVMAVEKGDAAEGKKLIEGALKEKPGLLNADYNLGRAEMLLGNDAVAAEDFKRATQSNSEPEIIRQSWYQLGTVLRRMHHTEEAQQAFATFQKLKDAEEEDLQRRKRKRAMQQEQQGQETPPAESPKPQEP
jgi:tetratricopeptide (TPR) repeat protein